MTRHRLTMDRPGVYRITRPSSEPVCTRIALALVLFLACWAALAVLVP